MGHDATAGARADTPLTSSGVSGGGADRDLSPVESADSSAKPAPTLPPNRYELALPADTADDPGKPFAGAGKPDSAWPRTDATRPIENPEALDRANAVRDAQLAAHGKTWARTHTAAYDVNTGEVSVGASGRGTNNCAETNARAGLEHTADEDVRYTEARGWRKNPDTGRKELVQMPICGNCQDTTEPWQYPPGTQYQPDARWDRNAAEK